MRPSPFQTRAIEDVTLEEFTMDASPAWTQIRLDPQSFVWLVALVEEACGIKLSDTKRTMLETRLRRRLLLNDIASFSDYVDLLATPEGRAREMQGFVDAVVTNETSFFRESAHFDHLTSLELGRLAAESPDRRVRAWSAASSSGEEAYSLAMVLDEASRGGADWTWSILATDISIRILQAAREAVYSDADAAGVPERMRRKYLLRSRDTTAKTVRVAPELRRHVRFGQINLMHSQFHVEQRMDLVFCRNVLIYFAPEIQGTVIAKLCRHLRPGGLLFLGHSDTLRSKTMPLRLIGNNIYERLKY